MNAFLFEKRQLIVIAIFSVFVGAHFSQAAEVPPAPPADSSKKNDPPQTNPPYQPPKLPSQENPGPNYGGNVQPTTEKMGELAKGADVKTQIIKLASLGAAGFMTYQCVSGWPAAMAQCAMAGLLWSQFAQIQSYQNEANPVNQEIASKTTTQSAEPQPVSVTNDPAVIKTAEKIKNDLLKKGIKVENGKVTLPNGQQFSSGALASKGAAQGAGIDGGAYDQAMDKFAEAKAEATRNAEQSGKNALAKGGSDSGSSGGGMGGRRPVDFTEEQYGGSWSGQNVDEVKKRGLASLAGASKKMGRDNIGIAADNIFQMVQRRYDRKRQQKTFIEQ